MAMQQWAVSADGGYMANPTLSKKLRHAAQPMMKVRAQARPMDAFGKGMGDTYDFDKVSNVNTAGRAIGETERIPVTKFVIRKASMTIAEYGNSIEWTGKLATLSQFDLTDPTQLAMRNDMAKVLDVNCATEFKTTKMAYIPTAAATGSFETDGAPISATATVPLNLFHLKEIVDRAITDLVPPAVGGEDGDYVLVTQRKSIRGLVDDSEFQEWTKYTEGPKRLNGEIGRIYRTRIVETTHSGALTTKGTGSALGEGLFIGSDAVAEAVAIPEELRSKIPDDYGRVKGLAWYYLGGWKNIWDLTTDGEYRTIHITSA